MADGDWKLKNVCWFSAFRLEWAGKESKVAVLNIDNLQCLFNFVCLLFLYAGRRKRERDIKRERNNDRKKTVNVRRERNNKNETQHKFKHNMD